MHKEITLKERVDTKYLGYTRQSIFSYCRGKYIDSNKKNVNININSLIK